jgi:hypothetical protein
VEERVVGYRNDNMFVGVKKERYEEMQGIIDG